MAEQSDSDPLNCYVYVNILGSKTGDPARREIVPSSCIKKFNYSDYMKDNNIYKNKLLKIKLHPDSKKENCNVLYAAISHKEVMTKSKLKRFAPPANCETITDDSNTTLTEQHNSLNKQINLEDEVSKQKTDMIQNAKVCRKRKAQVIKENMKNNEEEILNTYLDELSDKEFPENQTSTSTPLHSPTSTSTPFHSPINKDSKDTDSDKITIKKQETRIKDLEHQLRVCRKEITKLHNIYQERMNGTENTNTVANVSDTACCSNVDPFKVHDKMFGFSKEVAEKELEYNEEGNVHIGSQVYCNPVAFNDAFKSKRPFNCLTLLSEGVYGLEELSRRCVRKQKNTQNQKLLSPKKRIIIEKKVYAFMRIKDLTLGQIDDFLDNINAYHRKVINGARARLDYLKKQKEKESEIDAQLPIENL